MTFLLTLGMVVCLGFGVFLVSHSIRLGRVENPSHVPLFGMSQTQLAVEETSEELTERLRREEAQQKRAEVASWEREFQEKLNETFMPPVPRDYLEVPLNRNTTIHDEPSKWSPRQDVPKDTLIEIGGFVRGDEVQGNPIWYYDKKSGRFFSSSDVDTHPQHLPQFRNDPRDTYTMTDMTHSFVLTTIEPPTVFNPMTKNPMYLENPTKEGH